MKAHKVISLTVAAFVVLGGVGTGVALAIQSEDKPQQKQEATQQPVTVEPQNEPVEAPVEQTTVQEQQVQEPTEQPSAPANPFQQGFSGWYAINRRVELGKSLPASELAGEKAYCNELTTKHGYNSSSTPQLHALVCWPNGNGHMAIVEQLNADGSIWVSEMNSRGQVSITDTTPAGGFNKVDFKLYPAESVSQYNYFY